MLIWFSPLIRSSFSVMEERLAQVAVVQIQDFVVVHGTQNFVHDVDPSLERYVNVATRVCRG